MPLMLSKLRPNITSASLAATALMLAITTGTAFGQENKGPYFNPDVNLASNAAMNDIRRAARRWEALNGSRTTVAQAEFIEALHVATKAALREPNKYIPIAPCFEITYKNAELERTLRSLAPSVSNVDRNPPDYSEKIVRLGAFLAERDAQEGYCAAFNGQ